MRDVTERCRRVRLLLASVNDPYPTPHDSIGSLAGHLPGPAPSRRVPCSVCLRTGFTAGRRICPLCGGSGWRRRRKGEDPFDEYTGEPVVDGGSSAKHGAPFRLEDDYRRLGEQLDQIEQAQQERQGVYSEMYGWEKAREAQERLGSYRELKRALGALQELSPNIYGVVRARWLFGVPVNLIGRAVAIEQAAIIWVQGEMRGEIRVPPWLLIDLFQQRKSRFEQLVQGGYSASEIASYLDLPKKRVKKMLRDARGAYPAVRSAA